MTYILVASIGMLLALFAVLIGATQRHRHTFPRLPERPHRPRHSVDLARLERSGGFRGVRIDSRCPATASLAKREFPFGAVPSLPVPGCDAPYCECAYAGLPERRSLRDRRSGSDRRSVVRAQGQERRSQRSRRRSDNDRVVFPAHASRPPS